MTANADTRTSVIVQRVRRMLGNMGADVVVLEHLSGGYTNDNYIVLIDGERRVARIGSAVAKLLGVDRDRERRVLDLAADALLIPQVIAFDVTHGDLLTRFVQGESAADRLTRAAPETARLAALLRRAHALPVDVGAADPRAAIRRYVTVAQERGFAWPAPLLAALPRLSEVAWRCCAMTHHDVNPWNVLHAAEGDFLLDWEYAGFGDPAFDLAGAAALWNLDEHAYAELLDAYGADAALRARLPDALWLFHMRELTWAGMMLACGVTRVEITAQFEEHNRWLLGAG